MTKQPSKTEQALRNKIEINLLYWREVDINKESSNVGARAGVIVDLIKEAGYKSPQECGACKELINALRKVYESLIPGKFDLVIQKPPTGLPQVGQFTPEEYQPILGNIPPELWELSGYIEDRYRTAEGRKTILEDIQRTRKAKADWLALPLERKVGLE